jgi:hypothetical protein
VGLESLSYDEALASLGVVLPPAAAREVIPRSSTRVVLANIPGSWLEPAILDLAACQPRGSIARNKGLARSSAGTRGPASCSSALKPHVMAPRLWRRYTGRARG